MPKPRYRVGKASGIRANTPTAGFEYVNAPADRCSVHRGRFGHRFVRYDGRDYALIGLYYVPRPWKDPQAFFVLRRVDGGGAPVSAWSGERRRLGRAAYVVRAGVYAVILAILLTLPAWFTSKPRASVPPAARDVRPLAVPRVPAGSGEGGISRSTPQRGGAIDRRPAPAVVERGGRARIGGPPRRLPSSATSPRSRPITFYMVSFGTFRDERQASEVARRVRAMGYPATASPAGLSVRVRGHRYRSRANAAHVVRILRSIGLPASVEAVNPG